jgi:hypothetical protein
MKSYAAFALSALIVGSAAAQEAPRAFPQAKAEMAPWAEVPEMSGVEYGGPIPESGPPPVNGWADEGGAYVADDMYVLSVFSTETRIGVALTRLVKRLPGGEVIMRIERMVAAPKPAADAYAGRQCGTILMEGSGDQQVVAIVDPRLAPPDGEGDVAASTAALVADLRTGAFVNLDPATVTCIFEQP